MVISTFVRNITVSVLGFFPVHNLMASPEVQTVQTKSPAENSGNASAHALRKKSHSTFTLFARSTSFCSREDGADSNSRRHRTSTEVPLVPPGTGTTGVVSVDPRIVPYGSLVIAPNGETFLAADQGSGVIKRTASRLLARKKKIDDPKYANAPVLDFFKPGCKQVGMEWDEFLVIAPPQGSFMNLKVSERKQMLRHDNWRQALGQLLGYFKFSEYWSSRLQLIR